ncbi:hypothetical protein FHY06_007008, partial [Variovorax sp. BK613]|nr:hypothetical protein [Variovorax sp. BK613]
MDGLVLENAARRYEQTGLARTADQQDGGDAVAAEIEEAVIDAHLRQA